MFRIQTFCLVAIFSCVSLAAVAQTKTEVPPKTAEISARPAPKAETKSELSRSEKGPVSFGLNFIFNFASNTNELTDGTEVSDGATFLRLEPQFEYYVTPEVPITFSAGWLRRSLNRGEDVTSASNELLLLLGTGYHLPVTRAFTLYGTAGLGGYFGSSSATNGTFDITTDTVGFGGNAAVGAGLNFSDHGQFRAGLTYTGLIGSESQETNGTSLSVVTHNVALNIGLFYNF